MNKKCQLKSKHSGVAPPGFRRCLSFTLKVQPRCPPRFFTRQSWQWKSPARLNSAEKVHQMCQELSRALCHTRGRVTRLRDEPDIQPRVQHPCWGHMASQTPTLWRWRRRNHGRTMERRWSVKKCELLVLFVKWKLIFPTLFQRDRHRRGLTRSTRQAFVKDTPRIG